MKESKKALVKAADNLAAQVQCVQHIWTRKPDDIEQGEYDEFYKSITKDKNGPVTQTHFIAEGEVTFKSLLFVPTASLLNSSTGTDKQLRISSCMSGGSSSLMTTRT
jgi:HSP90 family molecular chaperone